MKTITVRLPDPVAARLNAEACRRGIAKSDIVRERLATGSSADEKGGFALIADLIGAVEGARSDLSTRKKELLALGYGRKRPR